MIPVGPLAEILQLLHAATLGVQFCSDFRSKTQPLAQCYFFAVQFHQRLLQISPDAMANFPRLQHRWPFLRAAKAQIEEKMANAVAVDGPVSELVHCLLFYSVS
jgi:hypothetical protein